MKLSSILSWIFSVIIIKPFYDGFYFNRLYPRLMKYNSSVNFDEIFFSVYISLYTAFSRFVDHTEKSGKTRECFLTGQNHDNPGNFI